MRQHFQIGAEVIDTIEFDSLSVESRLLYFYIVGECDLAGAVPNVSRIVRGLGFSNESLMELYDNGYLLRLGNVAWVTHTWLNNTRNKQVVSKIQNRSEFVNGLIHFEAEPWASGYVLGLEKNSTGSILNSTGSEKNSRNGNGNSNGNGNGNGNGNPTSIEPNSTPIEPKSQGVTKGGLGENLGDVCPETMTDVERTCLANYVRGLEAVGFDPESAAGRLIAEYEEFGGNGMFNLYCKLLDSQEV